jgi:hypothetical protein
MNPYVLLVAGVVFVSSVGGAYFYGRNDGANAEIARTKTNETLVREAADAAQKATAELIAKIEVKNVEITQPVIREVRTRTVYSTCTHTPDGLRAVNNAITGRAEPAGADQLPRAQPARP